MQNIWDKKASNYQRFDGSINKFQRQVFDALQNFGVNFSGKSLVDIGCGTGVWTLLLAKEASHITAVDSSAGMIDILRQDAAKFSVKNVTAVQKSWQEFSYDEIYDIALTTMSPAIASEEDFKKFGRQASEYPATRRLEEWLKVQNLAYKSELLSESRTARRSFDEALENICWHLEINGLKFDKNEIITMLKPLCKDGYLVETIDSLMKLFVF